MEHHLENKQCFKGPRFSKADTDPEYAAAAENSDNWLEKIHDTPMEGLEPGDRVYFRIQGLKGKHWWKQGVIVGRKEPYI